MTALSSEVRRDFSAYERGAKRVPKATAILAGVVFVLFLVAPSDEVRNVLATIFCIILGGFLAYLFLCYWALVLIFPPGKPLRDRSALLRQLLRSTGFLSGALVIVYSGLVGAWIAEGGEEAFERAFRLTLEIAGMYLLFRTTWGIPLDVILVPRAERRAAWRRHFVEAEENLPDWTRSWLPIGVWRHVLVQGRALSRDKRALGMVLYVSPLVLLFVSMGLAHGAMHLISGLRT